MATANEQLVLGTVIPQCKEFLLTHYKQRSDWDCGLSCILMILPKTRREYFVENFERICMENEFGRSTWTIDLCFVLEQFHVPFRFVTRVLGVNTDYLNHSYYNKVFSKDEARVQAKFEKAFKDAMPVEQKTISFDDLIEHLATKGPIILLTNAALLSCDNCKKEPFFRSKRYAGHYVVLCGYDLAKRRIKYRNPAKENHICMTSFELMDAARTDYGTDDDAILLYV